jgi:hypothetical protein
MAVLILVVILICFNSIFWLLEYIQVVRLFNFFVESMSIEMRGK